MGPILWLLFVYVLGGVTFIPLVLGIVILHAHYTFPKYEDTTAFVDDDPAKLKRAEDEKDVLKTATDALAEKFQRKHESDVAAGYFAVCREYVPGGVNGKPPDKLSPTGEALATESPSVYQSMYRSIFDRSQKPTIEPSKDGGGKTVKRANNVFYVVLRHGHLMLYDDIQQLNVRYVISLEYHDIDLYGGGEELGEGELWIKRNSIRLQRNKASVKERGSTLPFFLFGENISEKEDFYFALLNNQEKNREGSPPEPQQFEIPHIVSLVQKLHSSEEQLQTRWLNAMMGRLFLAVYKTPQMEEFFRKKLLKKISRVKKPNFITRLALQKIELGEGAPFITNPRLKDLTVDGDCIAEADVAYSGNFRIQIAATARIDLGTRFKAREVELVLAVTCKKMQGHALVRFKPPPSNRIWFTFEKMPRVDMTIEPIVSSRQITYAIVLKAIESRIREVIAETIVLPFWDDTPFLDTHNEHFRGGIWKTTPVAPTSTEIHSEDAEDEAESATDGARTPELASIKDERTMSTPALSAAKDVLRSRAAKRSVPSLAEGTGTTSSMERSPKSDAHKVLRPSSSRVVADPMLTADHADGAPASRGYDANLKRDDASAVLKDLSARSMATSPVESPAESPPSESMLVAAMKRTPSNTSKTSTDSMQPGHVRQRSTTSSVLETPSQSSLPITPTTENVESLPPSLSGDEQPQKGAFGSAARSFTAADRKQAIASISAASAAAQAWGWGVINKKKPKDPGSENVKNAPSVPMGRGRPLPPPGIPLPPPERSSIKGLPFSMPKRKPLPPPLLPTRPSDDGTVPNAGPQPSPKPPLPERRRRQSSMHNKHDYGDELLIVAAPTESAPNSPTSEHRDEFFGHSEGEDTPKLGAVRDATTTASESA